MISKTTFALFFGNRGFFPSSLIADARREVPEVLRRLGHKCIMLDEKATDAGAVRTPAEGEIFADFLRKNRGKFGGVIVSLPNFGDESGAMAALKDCGVPILIQAYPDDLEKMSPEWRRDAFCGKISIMDVFCQNGLPFTALKPHVVSPVSSAFESNIDFFDRVCRVVNGMRDMVIGALGARTTPFKTVRFDELALQKHRITVETFDLTQIFEWMRKVKASDKAYKAKAQKLAKYSCWKKAPKSSFESLVRLGVVLDMMVEEYKFKAIAIRCWTEMQEQLGFSPCIVMGEMSERLIPCACEVDVGNAVAMFALQQASDKPVACLDWNNNYGDDEDKCILFHCGPVPASLMTGCGMVEDQLIIARSIGKGKGFGCNVGRIAPTDFTFGSMRTDAGKLEFYLGEGRFTNDSIPDDFFGCGGVAEIPDLQNVLLHIALKGHRHHVSITPGHNIMLPIKEALERYIGCSVVLPQMAR
jgi:L-fucose isomerase-like protein